MFYRFGLPILITSFHHPNDLLAFLAGSSGREADEELNAQPEISSKALDGETSVWHLPLLED